MNRFRVTVFAVIVAISVCSTKRIDARTFDLGAIADLRRAQSLTGDWLPAKPVYDPPVSIAATRDAAFSAPTGDQPADTGIVQTPAGLVSLGVAFNSIAPGSAGQLVPWARRGLYSFADVVADVHQSPFLSRVRTYYKDVITIAWAPTTETGLAILTGLGLVAVQLRRAQRLVQHRPLAR